MTDRQFLQFLKTELTIGLFGRILAKNPDLARKALMQRVIKELG
jgi:hypothetical protein